MSSGNYMLLGLLAYTPCALYLWFAPVQLAPKHWPRMVLLVTLIVSVALMLTGLWQMN